MFHWYMRAVKMGDGDAAVRVGYCHQYGIGTRRNPLLARHMFRRALTSRDISDLGREEAMYQPCSLIRQRREYPVGPSAIEACREG